MEIPEKCWYCGQAAMVEDAQGAVCTACGATWSPLGKLGPVVLEAHRGGNDGRMRGVPGPGALARRQTTSLKADNAQD